MAQQFKSGITEKEWNNLPLTFGCKEVAKVIGSNVRYVQNHPEDLGGVKLAGHWLFSKPKLAAILGIA